MKVENILSQTIEIWLRIFGIWPDSSCISLRRLFWIIALALEQIFQYQYIIIHFYSIEFFEVMGMLGEAMTFSILIIKLVIFWCKQR